MSDWKLLRCRIVGSYRLRTWYVLCHHWSDCGHCVHIGQHLPVVGYDQHCVLPFRFFLSDDWSLCSVIQLLGWILLLDWLCVCQFSLVPNRYVLPTWQQFFYHLPCWILLCDFGSICSDFYMQCGLLLSVSVYICCHCNVSVFAWVFLLSRCHLWCSLCLSQRIVLPLGDSVDSNPVHCWLFLRHHRTECCYWFLHCWLLLSVWINILSSECLYSWILLPAGYWHGYCLSCGFILPELGFVDSGLVQRWFVLWFDWFDCCSRAMLGSLLLPCWRFIANCHCFSVPCGLFLPQHWFVCANCVHGRIVLSVQRALDSFGTVRCWIFLSYRLGVCC